MKKSHFLVIGDFDVIVGEFLVRTGKPPPYCKKNHPFICLWLWFEKVRIGSDAPPPVGTKSQIWPKISFGSSPNSSHWTRSSLSMCLATSFNGSKSEESEEREYLLWQAADDCVVSTIALLFFAVLIRRTLRSYIDLLDQLNFPKLVQLGLFAFVV